MQSYHGTSSVNRVGLHFLPLSLSNRLQRQLTRDRLRGPLASLLPLQVGLVPTSGLRNVLHRSVQLISHEGKVM